MRVDIYASALRPHALTSGHSACTLYHPKSPSLNTHFISFSYIRFVRSQLDPDDEAFPDKRLRYIATSAEAAERRASPRGKSDELQYPSTIPSAAVIRHMHACIHAHDMMLMCMRMCMCMCMCMHTMCMCMHNM